MDENNELTAQGLKECIVKQFPDLTTSERTIARARQELGWVHQTAKYCQLHVVQDDLDDTMFEIPFRELREASHGCRSRRNLAGRLANLLFTDEEKSISNYRGVLNKKKPVFQIFHQNNTRHLRWWNEIYMYMYVKEWM